MILDIPSVLRRFVTSEPAAGAISVARIETTTPVYLAFDAIGGAPRWVVRIGESDRLRRVHRILETLHVDAPDLVPRSLCCEPFQGTDWIHIQSGLAGRPWFRLRQSIRSDSQWTGIQAQARGALIALHGAIERQPTWTAQVDAAAELRRQIQRVAALGLLSSGHRRVLDLGQRSLDAFGVVWSKHQHGDFALNNLLFSAAGAAVIDFDECGQTAMPLHDEFSLALSFDEMMPLDASSGIGTYVTGCLADTVERSPRLGGALEGLFLHHLLWRIAQCADMANRARMRSRFLDLLERFARDPRAPFAELRRKIWSASPC
jgi:hypothetical protein